jgi:hypothetical protein
MSAQFCHAALLSVVLLIVARIWPVESMAQTASRPLANRADQSARVVNAGTSAIQFLVHAVHAALLSVVAFQQLQITPEVSRAKNWSRLSDSGPAVTSLAANGGAVAVQLFVHAVHAELGSVVDFQQLHIAPALSTAQNCKRLSERGAAATQVAANGGAVAVHVFVHAVHAALLFVVAFQQLQMAPAVSIAQNCRRPSESGAAATCFALKGGALAVHVLVHAVHGALLSVVDFQQLQMAPAVSTAQNCRRPSESGATARFLALKTGSAGVHGFFQYSQS